MLSISYGILPADYVSTGMVFGCQDEPGAGSWSRPTRPAGVRRVPTEGSGLAHLPTSTPRLSDPVLGSVSDPPGTPPVTGWNYSHITSLTRKWFYDFPTHPQKIFKQKELPRG